MTPTGILNVLKPPGMTSHDVVACIRRIYGLKRVGHAGTLDPAAAGVLPVFLGAATRLIEYTTDSDKAYRVELTFGYSTDSGDDTGKITVQATPDSFPSSEQLTQAFREFTGTIEQIPPMHSAIKIDGKRLYELARNGISIDRQPRIVIIKSIELLKLSLPTVLFDVTCSKGTYIRSLCSDIGTRLGCPAVMSFLVRTRVGGFSLVDASTLEEIAADKDKVLLPLDHAIGHIPAAYLSESDIISFRFGQSIHYPVQEMNSTHIRVYTKQGTFIGIGEISFETSRLSPIKVLS